LSQYRTVKHDVLEISKGGTVAFCPVCTSIEAYWYEKDMLERGHVVVLPAVHNALYVIVLNAIASLPMKSATVHYALRFQSIGSEMVLLWALYTRLNVLQILLFESIRHSPIPTLMQLVGSGSMDEGQGKLRPRFFNSTPHNSPNPE
jgi:hypothetical protein